MGASLSVAGGNTGSRQHTLEPPGTDPYAGWCGGRELITPGYPIRLRLIADRYQMSGGVYDGVEQEREYLQGSLGTEDGKGKSAYSRDAIHAMLDETS